MAEIDLTPTEEMASNAARGLELREKHGRGGTAVGVARARDIKNRKNLSPETVRRMHAFFSRHEKNKAGGEDDAGYIAWLLWGGDSGQGWAKRKVEQMDKSENQRSETYKAIAERLGSAAKFAITKEQIRGASREELRSIEQRLMALAKSGDKNAAALLDYVEEEYNDRYRGTHARPGAKATFAAQFQVGRVYEHAWANDSDSFGFWKVISRSGSMMVVQDVGSGGRVRTTDPQDIRYVESPRSGEQKRVKIYSDDRGEYAYPTGKYSMAPIIRATNPKSSRWSKTGSKATFAQDARAVAQEILRQLGGGRFMAMVGGKNAMHGMFGGKPGLQVSIGKGAEGGINRVIVTLDPATDTYNMEFWRIGNRGLSTKKVSEAHGVYADDLQRVFTDRTKFYTSMSRPGAKARFADGTDSFLTIKGVRYRIVGTRKDAKGNLVYDLHGTSKTAHPVTYTLVKFLDDQRWVLWGAQGQEVARGKMEASRPGAKARFSMTNAGYKALVDAIRVYGDSAPAAVMAQAKQMKQEPTEFTDNEVMAVIAKMKQARASRPGAKAKFGYEKSINIMLEDARIPDHVYDWRNGVLLVDAAYHDRIVAVLKSYVPWEIKSLPKIQKVEMSRPGAKAEMGRHWVESIAEKNRIVAEYNKAKMLRKNAVSENASRRVRGLPAKEVPAAPEEPLFPFAFDAKTGEYEGLVLGDERDVPKGCVVKWKHTASRPGAKVTNAVREGSKISAEDEACLKVMSAADEKVSDKIRTLIAEGKPQKQAVAIALDLERRGEL